MAGDHLQRFKRTVKIGSGSLGYKVVTGTVETVTANTVFGIKFIRHRIEKRCRRHCLMKRCIEYRYIRHSGEDLFARGYTGQVGRIVQRSQSNTVGNNGFYFVIYQYRTVGTFSTMYNTVSHRFNLTRAFDYSNFRINQFIQNCLDRISNSFDITTHFFVFLVISLVDEVRIFQAKPFNLTFGQNHLMRHAVQSKFYRGTPGIQY